MPACTTSSHPALERLDGAGHVDGPSLLRWLARIPDPRKSRGVRHVLAVVLVIAACAVVAGCRSLSAIGQWAQDLPQHILETLDTRCDSRTGQRVAPSEPTLRRALQDVDGDAFDQAVCGWLAEQAERREPVVGMQPAVAVDGKSVRGARTPGGSRIHLMAALDHTSGVVLGQVGVG
ncbi:transposase family protein [Streptomyces sp. NPDC001667]